VGRILLVEDSEESKDLVFQTFRSTHDLVWAESLNAASKVLEKTDVDLILLDVSLPDGDGFHYCSLLQNDETKKNIPVVFLTCRDSVSDKVLGISLGADDYVAKPFAPVELKARVEMRLKKSALKKNTGRVLKKGNIEINLAEQRAYVLEKSDKRNLELTQLEFKILVLLATHEEEVFSRDRLLSGAWGANTFLTDRCVDTHIYALRKKLGEENELIKSIYGQGYRFSHKKAA